MKSKKKRQETQDGSKTTTMSPKKKSTLTEISKVVTRELKAITIKRKIVLISL